MINIEWNSRFPRNRSCYFHISPNLHVPFKITWGVSFGPYYGFGRWNYFAYPQIARVDGKLKTYGKKPWFYTAVCCSL